MSGNILGTLLVKRKTALGSAQPSPVTSMAEEMALLRFFSGQLEDAIDGTLGRGRVTRAVHLSGEKGHTVLIEEAAHQWHHRKEAANGVAVVMEVTTPIRVPTLADFTNPVKKMAIEAGAMKAWPRFEGSFMLLATFAEPGRPFCQAQLGVNRRQQMPLEEARALFSQAVMSTNRFLISQDQRARQWRDLSPKGPKHFGAIRALELH